MKNKFGKTFIFALIFSLVFSVLGYQRLSNAGTHTIIGTQGYCPPGEDCSAYYANHFTAQFQTHNYAANPTTYLESDWFKLTQNKPANTNGDQWGLMTLYVYSQGEQVVKDISQASNLRREVNSSYWVTINRKVPMRKGNNRVDFHIGYVVYYPSGVLYKRFYPVLSKTNVTT
ncbi:hypothetical protein [Paenisporosarcina sp. TG20]|uniref:hypothetical protein n=1 Tax=Paenisporosarcina sp. TG20 TaxID=1211706 RepID=UPI0002F68FC6|nr:hypothetical protein [Paenisporosarcina sp. TG20]